MKGMDGYFYLDQMVRMKFRLMHFLIEICRSFQTVSFGFSWARSGYDKICTSFPRNTLVVFHGGSTFLFDEVFRVTVKRGRWWFCCHFFVLCSVGVANNFVQSSTAADHREQSFGELTRFIYCLLQKLWKISSLPLAKQWEEYGTPNHSRFDEKGFLSWTRVMIALDKVGNQYLRNEFRRDARLFLEEFLNCLLSTVASRLLTGRCLSCFCPEILIGGDNVAPFQMLNNLLDGLLQKGWTIGSKIEACRAEYQSFVQEQRQLQRWATRSCLDVGDALSFCSAQVGFRARHNL